MRKPNSNKVCSFVDLVTDVMVNGASAIMNVEYKLEAVLLNLDDDEESDGYVEFVNALQGIVHFGGSTKEEKDNQLNFGRYPGLTDKELFAIGFAMEKFQPYLMGAKVIVHIDHAALRYLMNKKDSKARLMWRVLLL
ncbi:PREDICTED: uncharacterized protein LOC109226239 [Nicotiana attenuata]|uniref:uncharacterized protein LOC109226239 n=1 Tax=Nicotiana attenuata TaxID=49451 RepID=UPI00090474C0|nr:PREDICTED: uncharacterized protein LOC109226239 [Nicotiana attenuata]